jgi:tetratricopeptide (TPR) repeat protein
MNFDAWRHYLRGRLFQRLRRRERALAEYRAALKHDPHHARAAHAAAFLLAGTQRWAEARDALLAVLKLEPGNGIAWFNLGFARQQLGETDAAIDALRAAVEHSPKLDRAWYGLGLALARQHDHSGAAQAFESAAKLQPENGHIWYQLGRSYHALHETDKVKGIAEHLNRFARHHARQLILDTGRSDLTHLVADLRA